MDLRDKHEDDGEGNSKCNISPDTSAGQRPKHVVFLALPEDDTIEQKKENP